jgi:hypothetical protein
MGGRKVRDILEQYQAEDALEIIKLTKEIELASNHSSVSSKLTVWSVELADQTNEWTAVIRIADELKSLKDSWNLVRRLFRKGNHKLSVK